MGLAEVVEKQEQAGKGLQSGALGLWGNVTIGLASTAPAYSLAATLGYVVLAVGDRAPAMFLLAFLPMLSCCAQDGKRGCPQRSGPSFAVLRRLGGQ